MNFNLQYQVKFFYLLTYIIYSIINYALENKTLFIQEKISKNGNKLLTFLIAIICNIAQLNANP